MIDRPHDPKSPAGSSSREPRERVAPSSCTTQQEENARAYAEWSARFAAEEALRRAPLELLAELRAIRQLLERLAGFQERG